MTIDSLPLLNTATILTLAFATLFRWQSPMQGLLFLIVSTSSSSCFGCWSKLHWNYWTSLEFGINVNSSSPWFPWLSFWGCSRVQHKGVLQKEQICRPGLRYLRQTLLVMLATIFSPVIVLPFCFPPSSYNCDQDHLHRHLLCQLPGPASQSLYSFHDDSSQTLLLPDHHHYYYHHRHNGHDDNHHNVMKMEFLTFAPSMGVKKLASKKATESRTKAFAKRFLLHQSDICDPWLVIPAPLTSNGFPKM